MVILEGQGADCVAFDPGALPGRARRPGRIGKRTFAARNLSRTETVSSDGYRALFANDPNHRAARADSLRWIDCGGQVVVRAN